LVRLRLSVCCSLKVSASPEHLLSPPFCCRARGGHTIATIRQPTRRQWPAPAPPHLQLPAHCKPRPQKVVAPATHIPKLDARPSTGCANPALSGALHTRQSANMQCTPYKAPAVHGVELRVFRRAARRDVGSSGLQSAQAHPRAGAKGAGYVTARALQIAPARIPVAQPRLRMPRWGERRDERARAPVLVGPCAVVATVW